MKRLEQLVREMFVILDRVEMSDEGREFHPTNISSCRVMDSVKLDAILGEMRFGLQLGPVPKLRTRDEIEPGICPRCHGTGDISNHERYSDDCTLCDHSGRVKECPDCKGAKTNRLDSCETCRGFGLVPDKY